MLNPFKGLKDIEIIAEVLKNQEGHQSRFKNRAQFHIIWYASSCLKIAKQTVLKAICIFITN